MSLVLDASVALSWLLRREDPGEAETSRRAVEEVVRGGGTVPALFFTELANGLLMAVRSGSIDAERVSGFLADLNALPIEMDGERPEILQRTVFGLARSTGLTAYDATYLELALRTGSTLSTFDRRLASAADSMKVAVFGRG